MTPRYKNPLLSSYFSLIVAFIKTSKPYWRNGILLSVLLVLSGCVGISVISEQERGAKYPSFKINQARGQYTDINIQSMMVSAPMPYYYARYSKEDILSLWGKPDSSIKRAEADYWSYKREMGFSGIVLNLIIPIPLLFPSGYRDTVLIFENDQLEYVIKKYGGHSHGFNCSIFHCTTQDDWEALRV